MAFAIKGVNKLSSLIIDADKDWVGKGITNIKQIATGMTIGSVVQHNGTILENLPPGLNAYVLTSQGVGEKVLWAVGSVFLNRFFPIFLDLSFTALPFSPDASRTLPAPLATPFGYEGFLGASLHPEWFESLTPAIQTVLAETLFAPDHTKATNGPVTKEHDIEVPVAGAVADDGGVQTDETAAAKSGIVPFVSYPFGTVQTSNQVYTTGANGQKNIAGVNWSSQSFSPTVEGWITQVKLTVYKVGVPAGNLLVSIRITDANGRPTGVDLAAPTSVAGTLFATSPGSLYTFAMNPVHVVPGQKYAIVVAYSSANVNEVYWRWNTAGTYTGGKACASVDSGVNWADEAAGTIFMFQQYWNDETSEKAMAVNSWEAQTFTTVTAHAIRYVDLKLNGSTPEVITASIRAVDGGNHPTGPDLCVGTLNTYGYPGISIASPGSWYRIYFTTPYDLAAATRYAICVRKVASVGTFNWRCETASPTLANGNREFSTTAGGSWTADNTADFLFSESGTPVADMTLLPAAVLAGDAYYWGYGRKFPVLIQDINPAGAGTYTGVWEYSQGAGAWAAATVVTDGTNSLKTAWSQELSHTPAGDWAQDTVSGIANLYWLRFRCTDAGAGYSQPKGCFARVRITT